MNRLITQIGQSIYEWFFTKPAQDNMIAHGKLAAAVLGTSTVANGLACVPTSPASLQVSLGPGEIYALAPLEATVFGTLAADTTHQIVKQGILLDPTLVSCPPPPTAGQAINYLIQVQYQDQDVSLDPTTGNATPVVLQFYNSSNPSQPWQGPNNSGQTSNTFRKGIVAIQAKAGIAATTGTQVTPTADTGWTGIWVVTVANGQTSIAAGNITQYSGAPILSETLTQKISQATGDGRYAALAGAVAQLFSVGPAVLPQHAAQFGQLPAVVGTSRNFKMVVGTASATATATADEIVVETALGGLAYRIANFSKTINLATTGVGGMDTGSAPNNGFVALYAIYNPTTLASALLAVNATAGIVPEVYGGANMPAGYTASALVAVVPTNGSGQIQQCGVLGRTVTRTQGVALSSTSAQGALTSLSLASFVPFNARSTFVQLGMANANNASGFTFSAFPDSVPTGNAATGLYAGAGYGVNISYEVPIYTAQTIWYQNSASAAGTLAFSVYVFRYTF